MRSLIQVDLLSIVELDVAVDNACSAMISKLALALQIELGVEIDEALGGDVVSSTFNFGVKLDLS